MIRLLAILLFAGSINTAYPSDTLVVGYTEIPPFIYEESGRLDGLNVKIWQLLMEDSGRPYRLVRMDFEDVLKGLEAQTIDLTIMPLSISEQRSKGIDFTMPYHPAHGAIAVDVPTSWQKFKKIAGMMASSNLLRGILILISIIFIFGVLGWYFEWRHNSEHFRKGIRGVWDGIYWSAVTLATVGYGDKTPKTFLGKLAALVLMLAGLVFVSSITAGIASSITADHITNDFRSISQFKTLPVGTLDESQTERYLKNHFFREVKGYENLEDGLKELAAGNIKGFMFDEEILRSEIKHLALEDKLEILPIKFNAKFYGFGVAKGREELVQELSLGIIKLRDTESWQMLLHEYGLSDFN